MTLKGRTVSVALSIDVECSIAGAITHPGRFVPIAEQPVFCRVGSRDWGVPYILETLRHYGLTATFFIEALQAHYFGTAFMGRVIDDIRRQGHAIELHLHPVWLWFDDSRRALGTRDGRPCDRMGMRGVSELVDIISEGIRLFEVWGERPTTLRTGGFDTSLNVYQAMQRVGLRYSSNVCVGINPRVPRACYMETGMHFVGDVMEVPVTSYWSFTGSPLRRLRGLTVTATSLSEMKHLLGDAAQQGSSVVSILTHPFEFVVPSDLRYSTLKTNALNQRRFEGLCRLLALNSDRFSVCQYEKVASSNTPPEQETDIGNLGSPVARSILRSVENYLCHRYSLATLGGWI